MKRPFPLLLVCFTYPPVVGGSEIEAQRTAFALRKRGYDVTVICGGGEPMPRAAEWQDPFGTPVRIVGNAWPGKWRPHIFAVAVLWAMLTGVFRYRLVYFLMPGLHVLFGVPFARLLGKRVVMKFSGSNEVRKLTFTFTGRRELWLLRHFGDRIMVLNPGIIDEALQAGFPASQIVWMPNPVDADVFRPCEAQQRATLRIRLGIPPEALVALFVGRLSPEKELSSLLEAFRLITARFPAARLVLAGDGPEREALEAQAAQSGTARNILFTGKLAPDRVIDWLQASDVFLLVSSLEGLPLSLIEAMAAELAPVVSNIPANLQIVTDRRNGLVVNVKDPVSISAGITALFDSPALRQELGRQGRKDVVARFSTAEVIAHYEAMFDAIGS